ncbi:retrovirus-related pol polyprotein from transposon TNT 1-94, partial [Tanacetum coccineum]
KSYKILEIASVAIIDRQLPSEYTITSKSTDVVMLCQMALPVQNINHSAFRSMFEREKLSGNNFNDWFHQLKLVLRVKKKMYVIEQPLPAAPAADSQAQVLSQWNAVYDAYNEVACLLLGSMTPELHRQFENPLPYDMIKELKSMFENQAGVEIKSHMVLGIAPVAIIDRQLPFEYTITSRSTDVVVMALPVQNINHSAFRSMFEREKLSGNNFNDWFHQLKLVLRVEKKMYVIEQPLPAAPAADSQAQVLSQWNAVYDAYNEVACLILGSMTPELHRQFENSSPYDMIKELKSMFEKQAGVERFDLIQTFHACKQEEGKPVAAYVLQMKGYVDQLEGLGYMLPQDLIVGIILNGLTKDFARFVRNYNMHNMGKMISELHAMLIEYENGLPKKSETPQVMMIKGSKIQKANKKSLKANGKGKDKQVYIPKPKNPKPSAKEHPAKDDTCHHCKEVGHWKGNCMYILRSCIEEKKQSWLCSFQVIFPIELFAFLINPGCMTTGCSTHICLQNKGLEKQRKTKTRSTLFILRNGVSCQG